MSFQPPPPPPQGSTSGAFTPPPLPSPKFSPPPLPTSNQAPSGSGSQQIPPLPTHGYSGGMSFSGQPSFSSAQPGVSNGEVVTHMDSVPPFPDSEQVMNQQGVPQIPPMPYQSVADNEHPMGQSDASNGELTTDLDSVPPGPVSSQDPAQAEVPQNYASVPQYPVAPQSNRNEQFPTLVVKESVIKDYVSMLPKRPEKVKTVKMPRSQIVRFDRDKAKSLLGPSLVKLPPAPRGDSLPNGYSRIYSTERGCWSVIDTFTGAEVKKNPNKSSLMNSFEGKCPFPGPLQIQPLPQVKPQSPQPQPPQQPQPQPQPPQQPQPQPQPQPPQQQPQPQPPQQQPQPQPPQQPPQGPYVSLPDGWVEVIDKETKRPMYSSYGYMMNSYKIPAYRAAVKDFPLPSGWVYVEGAAAGHGRPFYAYVNTRFTMYESPEYLFLDDIRPQPRFLLNGWQEEIDNRGFPSYRKGTRHIADFPIPEKMDQPFELPPGWTKIVNGSEKPKYVFKTGLVTDIKPKFTKVEIN